MPYEIMTNVPPGFEHRIHAHLRVNQPMLAAAEGA